MIGIFLNATGRVIDALPCKFFLNKLCCHSFAVALLKFIMESSQSELLKEPEWNLQ
jgi:hypothetical protein